MGTFWDWEKIERYKGPIATLLAIVSVMTLFIILTAPEESDLL